MRDLLQTFAVILVLFALMAMGLGVVDLILKSANVALATE
jgi:hypothetical protein